LQATDLATPSAGKGLQVVRTYNSRAIMSTSGQIGYTGQGWTTDPFDRYAGNRFSPDGQAQVMTPVPDSYPTMFTGPPGSDLSETVSSVNGGTVDIYLHGRSQEKEVYDYQGGYFVSQARLTDRNGNATTVSYGADAEYAAIRPGSPTARAGPTRSRGSAAAAAPLTRSSDRTPRAPGRAPSPPTPTTPPRI